MACRFSRDARIIWLPRNRPRPRWTSKSHLSRDFPGFVAISGRHRTLPEVYGSGTAGHRTRGLSIYCPRHFISRATADAPRGAPSKDWLSPDVVGLESRPALERAALVLASTTRTAATCRVLPARVPPKPRCALWRTRAGLILGTRRQNRSATAALTPYSPTGIPPPTALPMTNRSGSSRACLSRRRHRQAILRMSLPRLPPLNSPMNAE
jgi:hypothetical protein